MSNWLIKLNRLNGMNALEFETTCLIHLTDYSFNSYNPCEEWTGTTPY